MIFGVGAVLALFHDVVITTGLLVLLGQEFTLTIVAALLTLAGYSINDTIVVFDRIRENLKVMRTAPLAAVINKSVNQTLSRTVLTAVTTLMVIASLYLFGGAELRGFATAMFLGVVIGTYSSIFIASPAVLLWRKYFPRIRGRAGARA
jgi:preprotein translocase SecF subunit